MDRRIRKSRQAIFLAVDALLQKKKVEEISVTKIIAQADISRSTFYAHFESKEALFSQRVSEIFDHLDETLKMGQSHEEFIKNLFWHFGKERRLILRLLEKGDGQFKESIQAFLMESLYQEMKSQAAFIAKDLPEDLAKAFLTQTFLVTLNHYLQANTSEETATAYFLRFVAKDSTKS